jgi:periplasmic divalent cation tolerance protein
MATSLKLVLTTCGSRDVADRLAGALVERRLAACVNVLPGVGSTYRWQGQVEHGDEILVLIKTAQHRLPAIEESIRQIAGYELPEIVAVDIAGGSADYLAWIADAVGGENE